MKPFPATARAGSAVALLALSGCYYVGPGYYPYGYYPAVPTVATQHEVPVQGYGLSNGADAQNISPASPSGLAYVSPAPMYVAPAYYPAYYPP
jgi:predicted small lipoprotein YifL